MRINKIISLLLAGAMSAAFAGCARTAKEPPMASKENVYRSQTIDIPEFAGGDGGYLNGMCFYDGKILIFKNCSEAVENEDGTPGMKSWTAVAEVDFEGNIINQFELETPESGETSIGDFMNFSVGADGVISGVYLAFDQNESKQTTSLITFDGEGKIINSVDLSELGEGADYFYVQSLITDDMGNIYFISNNAAYAADKNGKALFESKGTENSWITSIFKSGDGRIFFSESGIEFTDDGFRNSFVKLKEIDLKSGGTGAEYEIDGAYSEFMSGNESFDAYATTDTALYGYDIETGEKTQVIDWLKAGFDSLLIEGVNILPDASVLCQTQNYEVIPGGGISSMHGDVALTHLTKLDPDEIPDKKLIMLSALILDFDIRNAIVEFNKTSEEYQIEVISYAEDGNIEDAMTKFNNDLTGGKIPDIIVNYPYYPLPMSSYISKGLIEDIYSLMDEDDAFNKSDYIINAFKALEENGGLFRLFTDFGISTVIGKTSDVGAEKGWSTEDLNELLKARPEGVSAFSDMTKESFLSAAMMMRQNEFIDLETKECSFDGDAFIGMLEFADKFPIEIEFDGNDQAAWEKRETAYRNGDVLLSYTSLFSFDEIRNYEKYSFGEEITFKGFPNAGGNGGSAFSPNFELSVTKKAVNKDGAWAFLKFLMTEAQDNQRITINFPIKLSALDARMEKAKQKPFRIDENGIKQEYDNAVYTSGGEVVIGENTDADNEKIMDLINSLSYVARRDDNINKIISEEAAAFFEGQKSAAEVAGIIQNRVSLYVNENS